MTLTELVPTLEVCQQLKEGGFPQDTALAWFIAKPDGAHETCLWVQTPGSQDDCVAAPTVGELMDAIIAKHPRADIVSMRGRGGRYWRIYPSGGWEMNEEPIDANSKDSSLAQLAALAPEVAG